jgi:hypothetical protein
VIPPKAIEQQWISYDVDRAERSANYPIVTNDQQRGLYNEVYTDWTDRFAREAAAMGVTSTPQYYGDVWSIQLTARPGYYVSPEQLVAYGLSQDDTPPWG